MPTKWLACKVYIFLKGLSNFIAFFAEFEKKAQGHLNWKGFLEQEEEL